MSSSVSLLFEKLCHNERYLPPKKRIYLATAVLLYLEDGLPYENWYMWIAEFSNNFVAELNNLLLKTAIYLLLNSISNNFIVGEGTDVSALDSIPFNREIFERYRDRHKFWQNKCKSFIQVVLLTKFSGKS